MRHLLLFLATLACATVAQAQVSRDAGSIARDLATSAPRNPGTNNEAILPRSANQIDVAASPASEGILIGAVQIEGAPNVAREAFAPAISDYLGKEATTQDLQALAKAMASVARERGYVFATAVVPQQAVQAGTVVVRVDEGNIAAVRIIGSKSMRLRRTLDLIAGPSVRREVLERQLLLAGDIPGIEIVSTRIAHEDIGKVLIVDVREKRGEGWAALDTYGSRDLGPVRARLRYDFIGIADDDDVLSVQAVVTPLNPRELAYVSARYAVALGTGGTQVGVTAALGRAQPSGSSFKSNSTYVSLFASTPLKRSNALSIWANAELGVLRVDGSDPVAGPQRDSMAVATGWLYATTRIGAGRLSGTIGVARGIGIAGTTAFGDPRASRPDASAQFTKGFFSADWIQPFGHGFALKVAANGQFTDRPLLAAQEIGVGGPAFGRAFDFSERFGDSGVLGSAELRWRLVQPLGGIDWIEPFVFADGGSVWNLGGGYGDGDLASAGGGVRAKFGKMDISVEAAAPIKPAQSLANGKSPRVNVSIGRRF